MKMRVIQQKQLLCLSLTVGFFFTGCQKENFNEENAFVTTAQIEKAKKEIQRKIETNGYEQKFEIQKRLKTLYTDIRGNIVENPIGQNFTSVCDGNDPIYVDVASYTRAYVCGQGYQLSVEWIVSWDNTIVYQHPTNAANKTTCTFKVSIPGNSNAFNDVVSAPQNITIVNLGSDPDNVGFSLISIRATATTILSPTIVNTSGAVLRLGAKFVSDCSALEQYSISPTSVVGLGWDVALSSGACDRNDKAWFQQPGMLGYRQIGVFGYDPLGLCSSYTAGVSPTHQLVQYSLDNGASWKNFASTSSPFFPLNTSTFVTRTDYAISSQLPVGTYDIKVRYANVASSASIYTTLPDEYNSCLTGTWLTPLWTVESYPGVIVN